MVFNLRVIDRDGVEQGWSAGTTGSWTFGRTGQPDTVALSPSTAVSKAALRVTLERTGLVHIVCLQATGSVEVLRANGLQAASLRRAEEGLFHPSLDIVLHTARGAFATVSVISSTPAPAPRRSSADPSATRLGWDVAMIELPAPGLEWFVVGALSAYLVGVENAAGEGRQVQRKALQSACAAWLGVRISEGWLDSKFKQARKALDVPLASNPSHEFGEYVIANGLLGEGALQLVADELARRKKSPGGPGVSGR